MDVVHGRNKNIDENYPDIVAAGLRAGVALGAGANRGYGEGNATTAGQATITVIGAIKLIAKTTGIFMCTLSVNYSGATAADVVTYTVKMFSDNVPGTALTLGNAASIGFGPAGIVTATPGAPGGTVVTAANNGPFTSTAGAGITLTGANTGVTQYVDSKTIGTAAAGDYFAWAGVVSLGAPAAGTGVETPFVIGTTALVTLSVTNSVAARATGNICLNMYEFP